MNLNKIVINDKCQEVIDTIRVLVQQNPNCKWSLGRQHSLFGLLTYYIAGKVSPDMARDVIDMYCEHCVAYDSNADLEDIKFLIQSAYSSAKTMAGDETEIELIAERHASHIASSNSWTAGAVVEELKNELMGFYSFLESPISSKASEPQETRENVDADTINAEEEGYSKKTVIALGVLCSVLAVVALVLGVLLYTAWGQGSVSQSDIDMKNAKIDRLTSENEELQSEVKRLSRYEFAAKEYDNHAVVVIPDVDNYYHRVGCSHFPDTYTYFTYNVDAAAGNGYSKCPDCFNQDFGDYIESNPFFNVVLPMGN